MMSSIDQWLPKEWFVETILTHPSFMKWCQSSLQVANETIVLTVVLELLSISTVKKLLSQTKDGYNLYYTSWWVNFRNHYMIGVPIMTLVGMYLDERKIVRSNIESIDDMYSILLFLWNTLAIITIHSILYYYVHKTMHEPQYYKYHRFHHRFNTYTPPVAANAVSAIEYIIAYMLPFAVGALIVHPTQLELDVGVRFVSITSSFVHTPILEDLAIRYVPNLFVSTNKHLEHHRRVTMNYASPTWNIDWILKQYEKLPNIINIGPPTDQGKMTAT